MRRERVGGYICGSLGSGLLLFSSASGRGWVLSLRGARGRVCRQERRIKLARVFECARNVLRESFLRVVSKGGVTRSKQSLKYSFCLWIVRLALRIGKPTLEFGLAFLLFGFVEHLFALSLVFNRASRESV